MRPLIRRALGALATLLAVSLVTFFALEAVPGDAASALAGENASTEQVQAVRAELGLDQPVDARYAEFLGRLMHGDLGHSLVNNRAVVDLLLERLLCTLILAFGATMIACLVGLPVGIAAAARVGSRFDTLLMSGAALGLAIPTFLGALVLMMVFAVRLRWLPLLGVESAQGYILPTLALALPMVAAFARLMRSSLLDVLRSDYVRTAHAKGLTPQRVMTHHVVRTSLLPVVTMLGLHLGHLLGGAFIVETIFALPGLGRLTVQAIFDRDNPVVIGATLALACVYVLINLAVDVAHGRLDPQVAGGAI